MPSLTHKKLNQIVSILLEEELNSYDTFIESGTLTGNTTYEMSSHFKKVHTIELSEYYYNSFVENLNTENITPHLGDSSQVIPKILTKLTTKNNCVFFLDGHWSSGDTAKGEKDCPLIEECLAIDKKYKANRAIILIDDYRLFGTKINEDWSDINEDVIKQCFTRLDVVRVAVFSDVYALLVQK